MSVDTRTPRSGFDDQPALSMVKVDCDPAQVIVNHASFRVQLSQSPRPARGLANTARLASLAGAAPARRRAPVVWSGRSAPGDSGATGLLQAVRNSTLEHDTYSGAATQVLPRVALDETMQAPTVPAPGGPGRDKPLLPPMRQAAGAYDSYNTDPPYDPLPDDRPSDGRQPYHGRQPYDAGMYDVEPYDDALAKDRRRPPQRHAADSVRHAYYPGRRMNLGVVLLPLRLLLGFISIYAGMGKLCDPVYFDGGDRGSMVKWLNGLNPWALGEPLRDFAIAHPVGSGLTVAFLQVVVGVLTVFGLWQRLAAVFGALLSAALVMTVSWSTVPVYETPDLIYLAAWSPLIIAGAPVYSVDGRLAGEAWRTLGPRSELWDLRRRVLRRGGLAAAVVVGLTMLVGSVLGGAVRSDDMVTVPGPNQHPTNHLPGAPLPGEPGAQRSSSATREDKPTPSASHTAEKPEEEASTPPAESVQETGTVAGTPSETQGSGQQPPTDSQPTPPPSSGTTGPTSTGGSSSGGWTGDDSTGGSGDGDASSGGGVIGGLLG
ncbi:DoxX family protein [Streptomyces peucetius]|uniref:DoxX family membrane protein n=1 Tax=Streptomyces peucetius TaxID=1950 RepID=A0ABY6I7H4_STRPE|nr:DoxX family protein [Streptomyces peucetius]UYQ62941.1 DoxX family membrane protein [Streptomyces peucetius]